MDLFHHGEHVEDALVCTTDQHFLKTVSYAIATIDAPWKKALRCGSDHRGKAISTVDDKVNFDYVEDRVASQGFGDARMGVPGTEPQSAS